MLANLASTPERGHLALLEALAQRGESLGGERATAVLVDTAELVVCLLYTSPSPRDRTRSRMPSSA